MSWFPDLKNDPDSKEALYFKRQALIQLGRLAEAKECVDICYNIKPCRFATCFELNGSFFCEVMIDYFIKNNRISEIQHQEFSN